MEEADYLKRDDMGAAVEAFKMLRTWRDEAIRISKIHTEKYCMTDPQTKDALAIPYPGPAVYFLVKDEIVFYIGKSKKLSNRMVTHRRAKPDAAYFIPIEERYLDEVEQSLIVFLSPKKNILVTHPPKGAEVVLAYHGFRFYKKHSGDAA